MPTTPKENYITCFSQNVSSNNIKMNSLRIKKINLALIHGLSPLLLGGLLYVLFRSTTLRMFNWCSLIGFDGTIQLARTSLFAFKDYFPNWIFYSLPDGLWVYSFSSAILILWDGKLNIWLLIPLLSGVFTEIAQGLYLFPGTFDIIDLFLAIIGLILSIIIINYKFKKHEKSVF